MENQSESVEFNSGWWSCFDTLGAAIMASDPETGCAVLGRCLRQKKVSSEEAWEWIEAGKASSFLVVKAVMEYGFSLERADDDGEN